jgi:predicted nucleotidyltransferase
LNRDHLAAGAIEALVGLRASLFERIAGAVGDWVPQPQLVGVFGSAARRDGDADSDIDIDIVVVTDSPEVEERAGELAQPVESWTGNACHVVTASTSDLRRMRRHKEPVLANWERDMVVIAGDRAVLKGARR